MNMRYKPLPVPIPTDYADVLGCSPSHLIHVNKGRKRFRDDQCHLLMEAAESDRRLKGLTILHLRQEIEQFLPDICTLCPRDRKRANKKKRKNKKE